MNYLKALFFLILFTGIVGMFTSETNHVHWFFWIILTAALDVPFYYWLRDNDA